MTYRIVDGFQRFPLGLVLGFQLGVGVLVKFLEFFNHLRWTDEGQMNKHFHEQMSPVTSLFVLSRQVSMLSKRFLADCLFLGISKASPSLLTSPGNSSCHSAFSCIYGWSLQPLLAPPLLSMDKTESPDLKNKNRSYSWSGQFLRLPSSFLHVETVWLLVN